MYPHKHAHLQPSFSDCHYNIQMLIKLDAVAVILYGAEKATFSIPSVCKYGINPILIAGVEIFLHTNHSSRET